MILSGLRLLVVEDEAILRLDLEDILTELGCVVAGSVGQLEPGLQLAETLACDAAILDVNLDGSRVDPIADRLARRGIPFLFTTGYGDRGQPADHVSAPLLEKPYNAECLSSSLFKLVRSGPGCVPSELGEDDGGAHA